MTDIPARLSIITLGARDMGVLRSFYRGLGWPELANGDDTWTGFHLGGVLLALFPMPDLTTEEATLLRELQSIWHDKYVIRAGDAWTAHRIGGTGVITADNGFELRPMITQDAINWNRETHGTPQP